MSIPDEIIEQVRRQGDLVEIVSEHTNLRRSGRTFRGPCPLHGGEGPNFSVDPAKNVFKCFVCGEAGDVFSFPMKHLGLDFLSAVRYVAERAGVEIPDPSERKRADDPRQPLFEINAFAADWFQRQWNDENEGREARAYLERRGIPAEAAERFGLGWAPERWDGLLKAARTHEISESLLLELGLIKRSTRNPDDLYDAFRGRLIFPIRDAGDRVIAFGGRILRDAGPKVPKYINSPESPVYHKSDVLYGLGWSRGAIRKEETALVVEGYMDYVALASRGLEHAVAPLGTAMTEAQAALLARYARTAILLYDSDTAGLKATFRSGDALLRAGVEVRVATLPDGEDPDSVVRAGGADALRPYLRDAVDVMERKFQILDRRGFFQSISGTRRAVDALLPTARATRDEVLRGVYMRRIAEKTGVPPETLDGEAKAADALEQRSREAADRRQRRRSEAKRFRPETARDDGAVGAERNLILLLLRDEAWVERAAREVGPEDFRHPVYRQIYEGLLHAEGERDAEGRWLEVFPESVLPTVEELRGSEEGAHLESAGLYFEGSIRSLQARQQELRLAEIERRIEAASGGETDRLEAERRQIIDGMRERGLMRKAGWLRVVPIDAEA